MREDGVSELRVPAVKFVEVGYSGFVPGCSACADGCADCFGGLSLGKDL